MSRGLGSEWKGLVAVATLVSLLLMGCPLTTTTTTTHKGGSDGSTKTITTPEVRTIDPGTYRNLKVDRGGRVILGAGYYAFDGVEITTRGKLTAPVAGRAAVYMMGPVTISDATINDSASPSNLILVALTTGTVELRKTVLKGGLYAPQANVTLEDCTIQGAVVGGNVISTRSTIKFDPDLSSVRVPGLGDIEIFSQEESTLR